MTSATIATRTTLAQFPLLRAQAMVKSACLRSAAGELADVNFLHVAKMCVADERHALAETLAQWIPLPKELPKTSAQRKLEQLASDMPGIANAVTDRRTPLLKMPTDMKLARAKAREELDKLARRDDFIASYSDTTDDIRDALPIWWAVLNHVSPAVRLAAVGRIPATGNLLSILLPLMSTDVNKLVRKQVRMQLGFEYKEKKKSWRDYAVGLVRARTAIAQIADPATTQERREAYLTDPRVRVRTAASATLALDSDKWLILSRDPSKTLRRLAAERVPLNSEEARVLARDSVASVATTVLARWWAAFDAGEASKPPGARPVRKALEERKAWKKRLENYFSESDPLPLDKH